MTVATAMCAADGGGLRRVVGDLDLAPSWPAHGYLILYGITSQSIGYLLIQISLPRLPAVLTSAILLAQPVMTVVFAIILLGEAPSAGRSPASRSWSAGPGPRHGADRAAARALGGGERPATLGAG